MESEKIEFEVMDVQDMLKYAQTVSRQRLSQIVMKFKASGDTETVQRLEEARKMLKAVKYEAKHGVNQATSKRLQRLWHSINARCGNKSGKSPAYSDVTNGFPSYEVFAEWAVNQVGFDRRDWEIDKDVLGKGNREYSPATCVFLPNAINNLFASTVGYSRRGPWPIGVIYDSKQGRFRAQMKDNEANGRNKYLGSFDTPEQAFEAYKEAKEAKIKEMAEKFKVELDPRAYEALLDWEVEITD